MLENIIHIALLATQFIAIVVLFIEIIYIAQLKASRFQLEMILLLVTTLIMLIGYSVELFSHHAEGALYGAALAYLGKPFAALMALVFIADYCGRPLSAKLIAFLTAFGAAFPIILFTNGHDSTAGHHLYYATVELDLDQVFSPLKLTRGPLYYLYMVYLIVVFGLTVYFCISEMRRAKTKEARKPLFYLFGMVATTIVGYAIYLSGVTKGYDTTMTGAAIGALLLTIVFFRFKLFDSLNLAKDQALHNASNGLLVVNEFDKPVFTNSVVDNLLQDTFTAEELLALADGEDIIKKNDRVFSIKKDSVTKNGREYGKTIEISDITIKYNYNEQLQHDVEERTKEIHNIQRSVIASFAGLVEARDNSTGVHIKRMSKYVEIIANALLKNGDYADILNENYITSLVEVAPLHDIGKLTIPDNVLLKPGKLTDEEFEIIKGHSAAGDRIIGECLDGVEKPEYVTLAKEVARHHHEKWNGKGYPDKLEGQNIPLCARIVAVADVYDAIRSERCYKAPMDKPEAKQVIIEGRGSHFDPTVVDAFLLAIDEIEAV